MIKPFFALLILCSLFVFQELNSQTIHTRGKLVWYDEFDGAGAPDPTKWDRPEYNRRANDNGPDGWWSREDSYLDGNGNLVIRVRKIPNKNSDNDPFDYSCGALRTKGYFEKLYGIFEIRCKLPTQQGWWVAFWMMQGNVSSTANGGVDGSEVDIMEAFGWTDKINQAVHWNGYGSEHKGIGNHEVIEGIRDGFHTYTLEWRPDEYIFYIDRVETWRTTGGGVCNQPGYLKVTGEISTVDNLITQYWANNPAYASYPDSFVVDYVRVYDFADESIETPIRELVESCYPDTGLMVGSACHEFYLGTQTEEILDREFHYVTPANDFKQGYIHPEPGVWNWERSDKWVQHCRENKQVIRMHAPISPQCSEWAKTDSRTAEELEQNMTEFMTELCKRYNDTTHIKWLDVVNETVSTDGTWFGPKEGTDKWENPWPKIGFDESHPLRPPLYIKKAFEIANQYGGKLKLIINQHGGMEDAMWNKIKQLVAYLRENNLRVDGIGWQAHIWMGWEKIPGNMEKLSALIDWCHENGLEFHITEFNVWLKPEDMEKKADQADTFYEITRLVASKHKTGFVGINFWHIRGVETQNKDRDGGPWAENYEPKEAVFRIKDAICQASEICNGNCGAKNLSMLVDTFGTSETLNLLGGEWQSFSDANSVHNLELAQPNGFENSASAKFSWELKKGAVAFPYAVCQTYLNEQKTAGDLSDYYALRFQCKGHGVIHAGLVTAKSQIQGNHFFKEITLKSEWTNVEIPFEQLLQDWGTVSEIDADSVIAIIFSAAGNFNEPGECWFDNVEFIGENLMSPPEPAETPEPTVFFQPKVNQLGYLPSSEKYFTITADGVHAGQQFILADENDNVVFSGNIRTELFDDSAISGEKVYLGDFSDFSIPGKYKIRVGELESFPFRIDHEVFDSTLFHSLRFFYLARANDAINDEITKLQHGEAHTGEFAINDGSGILRDVSGGWYNAGDFGKWVHTTAFACEHLLNLYEVNPGYFKSQNLRIPESTNELPDLLDQVKTGLDWLLKMQKSDGSVFHKVDSEPYFAYGYGPDEDPHARKLSDIHQFSTIDAADFTAVMAHAARVFENVDSVFAQTCRNAALLSWDWVQKNPGIGQADIYYTDPQSWQEEFWARAEIFLLTNNTSLIGSLYSDIVSREISYPSWTDPRMFAYSKLYFSENVPGQVKNWIRSKVENYAETLESTVQKSGYGCAIDKSGWIWGSNTKMSNIGFTFITAFKITGNEKWLGLAQQQLDYLLGRNSLNFSFVTGAGTNSCRQPFHWITKTYGTVPAGLIGQGATGPELPGRANIDKIVTPLMEYNFPPAKIYVDSVDSWNSNEVGIYTVSSFAGLMGFLALRAREIPVNAAAGLMQPRSTLEIQVKNRSVYCSNCTGKTGVWLFSLDGRQLFSEQVLVSPDKPLVNLSALDENPMLSLYKIIDETGKVAAGKLPFPVQ